MIAIFYRIHTFWWLIVLFFGLVAITKLSIGWLKSKEWKTIDKNLALLFLFAADFQFLFGCILWIGERRWNVCGSVRSWEHPLTMILALVIAHSGFRQAKAKTQNNHKFSYTLGGFLLSFAIIMFGIIRVFSGS